MRRTEGGVSLRPSAFSKRMRLPPTSSSAVPVRPTSNRSSAMWARIFREAAQLGVLHVHLSGGEPAARRDLAAITSAAHAAGLYTNLITSAVGLTPSRFATLVEAGLDHVQISIQDSFSASAD